MKYIFILLILMGPNIAYCNSTAISCVALSIASNAQQQAHDAQVQSTLIPKDYENNILKIYGRYPNKAEREYYFQYGKPPYGPEYESDAHFNKIMFIIIFIIALALMIFLFKFCIFDL